jgi:hypothetical protein
MPQRHHTRIYHETHIYDILLSQELTLSFPIQTPHMQPQRREQKDSQQRHRRGPDLGSAEAAPARRLDGAADGRARQRGQRADAEGHAEPRADGVEPRADARDSGGEEALEARGHDAVDDGEGVVARDVAHREPAEAHGGPD